MGHTEIVCHSVSTFQAPNRALPVSVVLDSVLYLCDRESTPAALFLTPCRVLALKLGSAQQLVCSAECEESGRLLRGWVGSASRDLRACFDNLDPPLPPSLKGRMEASGEGRWASWDGSKAVAGSWDGNPSVGPSFG